MKTKEFAKLAFGVEQIRLFDSAILVATCLQSPERMGTSIPKIGYTTPNLPRNFRTTNGSLVMSFDEEWFPFLCNSKGFNKGYLRWYVPKVSMITEVVADALDYSRRRDYIFRPGGRVFLNSLGVNRRLEDETVVEVLRWKLMGKSYFLR